MYVHISINKTARPRSQFPHSCICERFTYSHDRSTYSWEYINRSQIHECINWERGRTVSFLGIFVTDFPYTVFAELVQKLEQELYSIKHNNVNIPVLYHVLAYFLLEPCINNGRSTVSKKYQRSLLLRGYQLSRRR
jgi:hypothetical protein